MTLSARWSRPAWRLARAVRQRGSARGLIVLLTALSLAIVVESAMNREHDGVVRRMDRALRNAGRSVAQLPEVRQAARLVSQAAGKGLAVGVALTAAGFLLVRRPGYAGLLVGGTLSAWLLSAVLKLAFRIPRPGRPSTDHAISGYGFPSGHVLVTIVACGLLVWLVGPWLGRRAGRLLVMAAGVVVLLVGMARVILRVHFASDVIASVAIGVLWLLLLTHVAERCGLKRGPPLARSTP